MADAPKLYHVTQHRPDSISHSIICQFEPDIESLVVTRGQYLEILEPNESNDSLSLLLRYNCFSIVRCLACIKNTSVTSSDSFIVCSQNLGQLPVITQLTFDRSQNKLVRLHRYSLPMNPDISRPSMLNAEYLAVDPYGRAAILASLEAIRYVHAIRDQKSLTDSKDVNDSDDNDDDDDYVDESAKHTLGINNGTNTLKQVAFDTFLYEIEAVDRGEEANPSFVAIERLKYGEKQLVMYESNFGLSHISKLWSICVDESCNNLICFPKLQSGINDEGAVIIFEGNKVKLLSVNGQILQTHIIDSGSSPIHLTKLIHSNKDDPFIFIQLHSGKCVVVRIVDGHIVESSIESSQIPLNLDKIHFFRNGYVLVVSNSNHLINLLQVSGLSSSHMELEDVNTYPLISPVTSSFIGRNKKMLVGKHSTSDSGISSLVFGRDVDELASTPLPFTPVRIFATKLRFSNRYDDLILLSSANNTTTVLAVGEGGSVEEISEAKTGIASAVTTTNTKGMINGLVQIHAKGLRYISSGPKGPNVIPWLISTRGTTVVASDISATQVVLALSDMSVVYFKEQNGVLLESQRRLKLKSTIKGVAFSYESHKSLHSSNLFVSLDDDTIREFSIEEFKQLRIHNVQFSVNSLLSTEYGLFIGHNNGTVSLIREDEINVSVIGSNPVSLTLLPNQDVIALTRPRAWVFPAKKSNALQLCNCENMSSACSFVTEDVDNLGLVGISESNLLVLQISSDSLSTGLSLLDVESPSTREDRDLNSNVTLGFLRTSVSQSTLAIQRSRVNVVDTNLEASNELLHVNGYFKAFVSCRFEEGKNIDYIVLSCDKKLQVYTFDKGILDFVHETLLDAECTAMVAFKGQIVAAIKNRLVLFGLGQKQLLFKDEIILENCTVIKVLKNMRSFIYVGDSRNSVTIITHSDRWGFEIIGVDPVSRAVSSMLLLDFATLCIGNHYGEITILRFPNLELLADLFNRNSTTPRSMDANPYKLDLVSHFWVNDAVVQLQVAMLSPTAATEAIIYTGLQGTIGILIPFVSLTDYESYAEIEDALKNIEGLPLNVSISSLRGNYTPKRNIINGDFCEHVLHHATEESLSACLEPLELSVNGLKNKLASIRSRC